MTRPSVVHEVDVAAETSSRRQDDYIVVAIVDGLVDVSVVHRPAEARSWKSGYGREQTESFAARMEHGFPPPGWPSACGVLERGSIYNRGGCLAGLPVCPDCVAVLAGTKSPVAQGVRESGLTVADRDVLEIVDRHGEVTIGLVAQVRDTSRSSASNQIARLVHRGLIVRVGWGRYARSAEAAA